MKRYFIKTSIILFLLFSRILGQQFNLEWEINKILYHVGDLDGDGIGHLVAVAKWIWVENNL